jgi:hypothetical protein
MHVLTGSRPKHKRFIQTNNMRYLILILLPCLLACEGNQTLKVSVNNQSADKLDSVIVGGLGRLKFTDVAAKSEASGLLDYSKSKSRTDGGYKIFVYESGRVRDLQFGYYSNGTPINEGFSFVITADSIKVKQY